MTMQVKRSLMAVVVFVMMYIALQLGVIVFSISYPARIASWLDILGGGTYQFVFLFLLQQVIIFGLLWYVMKRWKQKHSLPDIFHYFKKRRTRKGRGYVSQYVLGVLLLYLVGNAALAGLLDYLGRHIPGLYGNQMLLELISGLTYESLGTIIWVPLIVVVVAPFLEELIFRGFITDVLMKHRKGPGVFLAATLFAIAHLERGVILNLFILAWILSYIYYKTGSMWYSFLFHVGINGLAMLAVFLI